MQRVRVGLLGFGTVGTGVVRIVHNHAADLERQIGSVVEIAKILIQNRQKPRSLAIDPDILTDDPWQIVDDPSIDVIVEVMGGIEPAKSLVLASLERGKQVVTANKDLMALHGPEILAKASACGCDILYEASVAGGIPILRTIVEGLSSDRITKMIGIVNGTTNYILTKMCQEGASYEQVLREAQSLGYAESDPTSDVEGFDAAYKMTILSSLGFRSSVAMQDVDVKGITGVTAEDIAYARKLGYEMKLLGIAEKDNGRIGISVQPTLVKQSHPLASVNGVFNAVYIYGEAVGETMFYGPGAGEMPTATSVVADLIEVAKNLKLGVSGKTAFVPYNEKNLKSDDEIFSRYFMLLHVDDKTGVLATIAHIFAQCGISLESVVQLPNESNPKAEIVIITHDASRSSIRDVQAILKSNAHVDTIQSVYRVEG